MVTDLTSKEYLRMFFLEKVYMTKQNKNGLYMLYQTWLIPCKMYMQL